MVEKTAQNETVSNGGNLETKAILDVRMVGSSEPMLRLDAQLTRVAITNHAVLITGESGTGKTTAAQIIHARSQRSRGPFIDINCAALPETLLESELFGHERGAFTGAAGRKKGLFEVAECGTLLLDEIAELKPELQAKLLKAIEQQKIRRLGGTQDIHCDVRVLAASSRNLRRMVKTQTFREDLYYRLAVLELYMPPLRERPEDIHELIKQRLTTEHCGAVRKQLPEITATALSELALYSWPGNIRQLHNVLARLTCHAVPGRAISVRDVRIQLAGFRELDGDTVVLPDSCSALYPGESLKAFSVRVRGAAIERVKSQLGNLNQAARRLRVDRANLYRTIHKIDRFKRDHHFSPASLETQT